MSDSSEKNNSRVKKSSSNIFQKYPDFFAFIGALGLITGIVIIFLRLVIPLHTNITIFVAIVIYITLASMRIRNQLYESLLEKEKKKELLEKIKETFKKASQSLDVVNTSAMLEKFYAEETFDFHGMRLNCEKWDYLCRILPNLLIAFGLLGTFWGITQNLSGISDILNTADSQNMIAVENLKVPLQSMGIAFISSLIALFCSVLITVTNFIWNTGLAKKKLLNSIEDHLDNEVFSSSEGDTRLSKAVNNMTAELKNFLIRFHEKVGAVLGDTLRPVAQQIADENREANENLTNMANRFMESAGTIHKAFICIEKSSQEIKEITSNFHDSCQSFSESADKIQKSRFSENLEELTQKLAQTQEGFTDSTKLLNHNIERLAIHIEATKENNQKSAELLTENIGKLASHIDAIRENNQESAEIAKKVYTELGKSSAQWQDGAIVFLESAEILKDSQFSENLVSSATNLAKTHDHFSQTFIEMNTSLKILKDYSQAFKFLIKQLLSVSNEVKQLNQSSEQLLNTNQDKIIHETQLFEQLFEQLTQLSSSFVNNYSRLEKIVVRASTQLNQTMQAGYSSSLTSLTQLQQKTGELATGIDSQTHSLNQNLGELLREQTQSLNHSIEETLRKIYQYHQSIFDALQEIQTIENNQQQETLSSKIAITESIDRNLQNMTNTLERTQSDITNLLSSEQVQIDTLLNALTRQSENYQLTLGEISAQFTKDSHKNKQDIVTLYQSLEKAFLNLGEINTKLSRMLEILNKQINESSTKSNITDLIDKLKGV